MKRAAGIVLILLTTLVAQVSRSEGATLFDVVTAQLIERYNLDTATTKIEVLKSQLADDSVSAEQVRIRPLFAKEPIGLVSVVAEVTDGDRSVHRGQISLRVRRYAVVVVAAANIKLHESITQDKLNIQTMEVTSLREQPVTSPDAILGYRSKRNLAIGQMLTAEAVEPAPDIEVGREVSIQYSGDSFTVATHGQALQSGWLGQFIRVRNNTSGKVILARVSGPNEVAVKL